MENLQVIGIIGYNFCGSTYLSRLMQCFPDVKSGGELHWVFKPNAPYEIKTVAGWPVRRSCVVCGLNCRVLTPEFISMGFSALDFYPAVARKLKTKILVSSDKLPQHYRAFMRQKQMDGIVLFKHPAAAMWSDLKNERRKALVSLKRWTSLYREILAWAPSFCRRVIFMKYEDVASNPDVMLHHIKGAFAIKSMPRPATEIDNIVYHAIGGNPGAHQKKGIVVDTSYTKQDCYGLLKDLLNNNQEALGVLNSLNERAIKL